MTSGEKSSGCKSGTKRQTPFVGLTLEHHRGDSSVQKPEIESV